MINSNEIWKTKLLNKIPKFGKETVLIVGLSGMGNVGKITVDLMLNEFKAKKIISFNSDYLTPIVLVNPKNLIEIPSIYISH